MYLYYKQANWRIKYINYYL